MKSSIGVAAVVVGLVVGAAQGAVAFEPADSPRLARAKDLIAEERWTAAIPELRAAVNDRKEQNKDEVLFWLAHSQNQAGDLAEAVESIRTLQANYPKSRWKQPAGSLMIELAQKLGRRDLLWLTAVPPTPPVGPSAPPRVRARRPSPPAPPAAVVPPAPPAHGAPTPPAQPTAATWFAAAYLPDTDLRVQALGRLIPTDAPKVIPILRTIALEADNPGAARRAVFILAQSRNPQAQSTVVDVAKVASETVRVAAVRELARFGGPNVGQDLLEVYSRGNGPVKQQVVFSLGERADISALFRIVQTEDDDELRDAAILTLGRAGGREQLRVLFVRASKDGRQAVIRGLFLARDEDGLIRIAGQEKDAALKADIVSKLRLLGTPKAKEYLQSLK
jgi:HEAT repeats